MWINLKAILVFHTLLISVLSKYLQTPDTFSSTLSLHLESMNEELEQLKDTMRNRAPSLNSLSQLNITLEAKRKLLRQYRQKLQELNQLDNDNNELVHKKDLYSYVATSDISDGKYNFPVNIPQPDDHRKEIKVQSAILRLHRNNLAEDSALLQDNGKMPARNVGYNTVLLVYQTLPGNMRRMITSSVISLTRTGPINIDVTEIAQNWIDEPNMNYGLEIECLTHNISHILSSTHNASEYERKASLDIYAYEKTINIRRQQRDVDQEVCEPGKCCRNAVNITLADVGHHVDGLHEEGAYITAYLCSGRCPKNYKVHNKWASIKNIIRSNDRRFRNRCAPTEYEKTFTLLHFTEETGELAFREYDDLIVKRCGCV